MRGLCDERSDRWGTVCGRRFSREPPLPSRSLRRTRPRRASRAVPTTRRTSPRGTCSIWQPLPRSRTRPSNPRRPTAYQAAPIIAALIDRQRGQRNVVEHRGEESPDRMWSASTARRTALRASSSQARRPATAGNSAPSSPGQDAPVGARTGAVDKNAAHRPTPNEGVPSA